MKNVLIILFLISLLFLGIGSINKIENENNKNQSEHNKDDLFVSDKLKHDIFFQSNNDELGENLFNKNIIYDNNFINETTGELNISDNYISSDYIKVNGNKKYLQQLGLYTAFYSISIKILCIRRRRI